ncbi:uncharacterized protein LOC129588861 isoform X2 [Paramacrobiotus metropolitanus]|uniref:uncharacterized protein LOC129588861 isoform X2 n=1 Tax=Paramacrobiotus metropolitanus TaxID=2943436 RepID=UPI0024458C65|nr:uncharacterized protein LOC129588861 isoform X2 [Paramacrobiotus metropolitanus]
MNDSLAEAMLHNRQDDRIILPRLAPSDIVAGSAVFRPRLGEDAAFHCRVPTGVDWRDVMWLHQDRVVFEAGEPLRDTDQTWSDTDTAGQAYTFGRVNDTLIFVVRNVTLRSGGLVKCVDGHAGPYTPHRRILQRFQLLPLITHRRDVFTAPDADYVSAVEGQRATVSCDIRLPLPHGVLTNLENHLMWVHHGRIVSGPWEAPYGLPRPAKGPPRDLYSGVESGTNHSGQLAVVQARLNFASVTQADGGFVQCLFRPHQGVHEWVMQTTTLLVYPKLNPKWFH